MFKNYKRVFDKEGNVRQPFIVQRFKGYRCESGISLFKKKVPFIVLTVPIDPFKLRWDYYEILEVLENYFIKIFVASNFFKILNNSTNEKTAELKNLPIFFIKGLATLLFQIPYNLTGSCLKK